MINTLSIPRTSKLAILASALVYTGLSFGVATGAAPVQAAGAPYYTAVLSAPASDTKTVDRDVTITVTPFFISNP